MTQTRVFWVVNSREDDEEIFETLEEAQAHYLTLNTDTGRCISVALVLHAYKENGEWTYDDRAETFTRIYTVQSEDTEDEAGCLHNWQDSICKTCGAVSDGMRE